jgi:hypothetical protein
LRVKTIFGKTPYSSHGNGHNLLWHIRHDIQAGTLPAIRPPGLTSLYSRLWEVILWCWAYEPSLRPPASSLHAYLEHLTDYPNLDSNSNSSGEGESSDTEEDHASPPRRSLSDSDASTMAMQLAPDNTLLESVIQALLQGDRIQEIPDEISVLFDLTSNGPRYTCALFKRPGHLCAVTVDSTDRFKHHLQSHLGITPYSCASFHSPRMVCLVPMNVGFRPRHVMGKENPWVPMSIPTEILMSIETHGYGYPWHG